jgi:hypothetical protein
VLLALVVGAWASPRTQQDHDVPLGPKTLGYKEQPAGDPRIQVS